ncbi:MAG: hypothetical protein JKX85_02315 [Phycisphaeraceae bacterium]|nr:hypothetical protein [Phycisphaeraceae bacterium]
MSLPIDTRFYADPLMIHWHPSGTVSQLDRQVLVQLVEENAQHLGTGSLHAQGPIIATGHQAWFWHPGILAKDIAMAESARYHGGHMLHLVVDHDVHPAMQLPIPLLHDHAMVRKVIELAKVNAEIPLVSQMPVDIKQVQDNLWYLKQEQAASLGHALMDMPHCENLAQQITVILTRLMHRWVGQVPILYSTQLLELPSAKRILKQMLDNALFMARSYNNAVNQLPHAGIAHLAIEQDRIELPVWLIHWGKSRSRVYADIADHKPVLVDSEGNALDLSKDLLAPKALFLSALMRTVVSQLFIHGKGGGIYDQVTEIWWSQWRQEHLNPLAIASADIYMHWDIHFAQQKDVEHARWYLHHLKHNMDRFAEMGSERYTQKQTLIKQLANTRTSRQDKKNGFKKLHQINDQLCQKHADILNKADNELTRALRGVANKEMASRRDWSFFLYQDSQIQQLQKMIRRANEHRHGV